MPIIETLNPSIYLERQKSLLNLIAEKYPNVEQGFILLFGNFESDHYPFKQERSLYYLTGIQEPAVAWLYDLSANTRTAYVPNFGNERIKWIADAVAPSDKAAKQLGVDSISYLGDACQGYQCHPFFSAGEYKVLIAFLQKIVQEKKTIFTCNPQCASGYIQQRFVLQRLAAQIPHFSDQLIDISPLVAKLRRKKSHREIELLYKAINITSEALESIARSIKPERVEYEIQALIEYIFTAHGGSVAFPSIVASGKNSTILHYHNNTKKMEKEELLVTDVGAEYSYYCADLTRTFPVSGTFSKRQREIYSIVLDTQDYIAQLAQPGYWLSNKEVPEKSLNHLARAYLAKHGYERYFPHGIGHFLGMDVHDVGDYQDPLEVGDVITIEPGIYIPEEQVGVRIEDNYWIVNDGSVCLSEDLPRHPDDIEALMVNKSDEARQEGIGERDDDLDEEN